MKIAQSQVRKIRKGKRKNQEKTGKKQHLHDQQMLSSTTEMKGK